MSGHWTDGIGFLFALMVLALIVLGAALLEWKGRDRNRRMDRLAKRGLA